MVVPASRAPGCTVASRAADNVLRGNVSENRAATRPPGAEARIGDLESAQRTAERALALSRGIFEPPHSQIARTLAGLGIVLNARGQTAASADAFRQALDMRREILGEGSPHLIPALSPKSVLTTRISRSSALC